MLDDTPKPAEDAKRWPLFVALTMGIITGLLTLGLEHSASPLFGVEEPIVTTVLFPGFLGAIAIAGNVHAFSLGIAAGINCIFYFLVVWMICAITRRLLRRFR